MQDKQIFKIATITTVIGLIGLIITTGFVSPEVITIDKIDNSKLDNQVQINGMLDSYTITKSGIRILKISDETGVIDVVIFPTTELNMSLIEGNSITVIGKVARYNGNLELILEESKNLKLDS